MGLSSDEAAMWHAAKATAQRWGVWYGDEDKPRFECGSQQDAELAAAALNRMIDQQLPLERPTPAEAVTDDE